MPLLSLDIPVDLETESATGLPAVGGRLHCPEQDRGGSVILLAHGAGAGMDSDFLVTIATELAKRGFPVLRFNYAYSERMAREGKRRPPDRRPRLEAVHSAALLLLQERYPMRRIVLAGKSMGGRIASYLSATGADDSALLFLGYPLHPQKKPEKLRSEHFGALTVPTLFLEGTRDPLCDLDLLRRELETFSGTATLRVIEGADHDFRVLKRSGRTRDDVLVELVDAIDEWERATFPA
jgi:predicted alpha/beta-hydrolase family hydrolase